MEGPRRQRPSLELFLELEDRRALLAALVEAVVAAVRADPMRTLGGAAAGTRVERVNALGQVGAANALAVLGGAALGVCHDGLFGEEIVLRGRFEAGMLSAAVVRCQRSLAGLFNPEGQLDLSCNPLQGLVQGFWLGSLSLPHISASASTATYDAAEPLC